MSHLPVFPVHPEVWKVALRQLRDGGVWSDIREKNRLLVRTGGYPGMSKDWTSSPYRWLLKQGDSRSLYRQFQRLGGVDVDTAPHRNVDHWLNPSHPEYNSTLAEAVFHYSARTKRSERFEICIATPEMKSAAWKYAHNSQIILDGTFGVCNSKILLFIAMALDEESRGVPIAFFLFSAPSGNKFTPSGYNTEILTRLLTEWRKSMGEQNGSSFHALVAITDTDTKERNALLKVFPGIWLILCKFHLRQCWTNHRNHTLKSNSQIVGASEIITRLVRLEDALVASLVHVDAIRLVTAERETLEALKASDPSAATAADAGISHLKYLSDNWVDDEMLWKSWSNHGRHVAAKILGCTFEFVLPTTNHLESFNNLLKNKHLHRWQNNSRPLRLDVLVNLLVFKVFPSIFEERKMAHQLKIAWETRIRQAGGGHLLGARRTTLERPTIAHLEPDERRDSDAQALLEKRQVSTPVLDLETKTITFQCYSAAALSVDTEPVTYTIIIELTGAARCDCEDFRRRGGACKHLRAALLQLSALKQAGKNVPAAPSIPKTVDEARILEASLFANALASSGDLAGTTSPIKRAVESVDDILREGEGIYEVNDGVAVVGNSHSESLGGRTPSEYTSEADPSEYASAGDVDAEESRVVGDTEMEDGSEERAQVAVYKTSELHTMPDTDQESEAPMPASFELKPGDARATVNTQTLIRTFFELAITTPRLSEFADELGHTHLEKDNHKIYQKAQLALTHVKALCDQLERLTTEFTTIESQPETEDAGPPQVEAPTTPQRPSRTTSAPKRKLNKSRARSDSISDESILNPSPQPKQKRKKSFKSM
ncbi:uncharacterized protein STEHIDRAFT_164089 [Stereum hirsutum FP-91666 SS1]|uniref:SWIM-type domain-containing protein n=1 Tax=Stereum hirsutum (strain FP-91666) TaxID=721885 RepID=R7RW82_STEHR|nr:uncharacterized protein STEHIDRAFT_164089 [Stereum hirsutum FP-91666 SS1]EIM79023.1 hypothetical protein STEHIDRAFT_164089 [Stereum hirsutum FP-91666 SS1]